MLSAAITLISAVTVPATESPWGQSEVAAVFVLLGIGGVLTLALGGFFIYILLREKDQQPPGS